MAKALTVKGIEAIKPDATRREIPDGLLPGLYLVSQPSGALSWAVRYRMHARPAKFTIGAYPAVELADAREMARSALRAVAEGRDPNRERKDAKRQVADRGGSEFAAVCAKFIERYAKANTRESTWRETERLLNKEVVSKWKGRAITAITRADVNDLLDGVVDRGTPIMANRVLAHVRRLFNWCVERGIIERSPCEGVKSPATERSRDRVLDDDELRHLWFVAEKEGYPFGPIVQLLILTGQRRDEVGEMRWREIDFDKRLWTIPRERAKNDIAHEVSLSDQALAILKTQPKIAGEGGLVFTTTGDTPVSGFSRLKIRLDTALAEQLAKEANGKRDRPAMAHWTLHDLRRTVSSGMARLGIQLPVTEKVLNHISGSFSGITRVYQRHDFADEKRNALTAWGAFVSSLISDRPSNVIRLAPNA